MIKFTDNREDIIRLWQSSFGDSKEEVEYFIDNVKGDCIAYYADKKAVAMLYLVDCSLYGKWGKYIYAACTEREYRGRGIMSDILDYCKGLGYAFICLIPANDGLIKYYKERGFIGEAEIESIEFSQSEGVVEYLLDGFSLTEPKALVYTKGD